jgi:hypothetical protein
VGKTQKPVGMDNKKLTAPNGLTVESAGRGTAVEQKEAMQLHIEFSFNTAESLPRKGVRTALSDLTQKAALLIKQDVEAKRIEDATRHRNNVIRDLGGRKFWEETRKAVFDGVNQINSDAGGQVVEWATIRANEIDAFVLNLPGRRITAIFNPDLFEARWSIPSNGGVAKKMTVFVDNDKFFWKDGANVMAVNKIAEEAIRELSGIVEP